MFTNCPGAAAVAIDRTCELVALRSWLGDPLPRYAVEGNEVATCIVNTPARSTQSNCYEWCDGFGARSQEIGKASFRCCYFSKLNATSIGGTGVVVSSDTATVWRVCT